MSTPLISVSRLSKSFGETSVFNDITFHVDSGSVTVIIGPSGSGKTTLLRSLNALEIPQSGTVRISEYEVDYGASPDAKTLAGLRAHSGMVFQGNNLFSNLTALGNIMEGPVTAQRRPKEDVRRQAMELLELVGLGDRGDAYPHQLSGGQQQRVGIARALALQPDVLLFDEPTSALDPELQGEVLSAMRDLAQQGWTMVVVTHEMRFARQVSDHVIFLADGGIVEEGGPQQVLENPRSQRTRDFLARILGDI